MIREAQERREMERQISIRANPTGSQYAYNNKVCPAFARDAHKHFTSKRMRPQKIKYASRYGKTVGPHIVAADWFGFFKGQNISIDGTHEGTLVGGQVYDNNVPFGVPRKMWESGYEVTTLPEHKVITIGEADRTGVGDITVE